MNASASPSVASYTRPRQLNSSKRFVALIGDSSQSFTIASMAVTRRAVLKASIAAGVGAFTGVGAHGYLYGRHALEVTRASVGVAGLAPRLAGLRIGLLTDVHRSLWVSADDVGRAV